MYLRRAGSSILVVFFNPGSEALTLQPFAHAGKKLNREVTPLRRESVVTLVKWKVKRDENYVVFQVYIE